MPVCNVNVCKYSGASVAALLSISLLVCGAAHASDHGDPLGDTDQASVGGSSERSGDRIRSTKIAPPVMLDSNQDRPKPARDGGSSPAASSTPKSTADDRAIELKERSESLDLIHSGARASHEFFRKSAGEIERVTNAETSEVGLSAAGVAKAIEGARRRLLKPIESNPKLRPTKAFVDDFYARAKSQLVEVAMPQCSQCITAESFEVSSETITRNTTKLSSLTEVGVVMRAESTPTGAKTHLFAYGDKEAVRSTRTNGSLGFVYVGKYRLVAELSGHKAGIEEIDLVNKSGKLIRCELFDKSSWRDSSCLHLSEEGQAR